MENRQQATGWQRYRTIRILLTVALLMLVIAILTSIYQSEMILTRNDNFAILSILNFFTRILQVISAFLFLSSGILMLVYRGEFKIRGSSGIVLSSIMLILTLIPLLFVNILETFLTPGVFSPSLLSYTEFIFTANLVFDVSYLIFVGVGVFLTAYTFSNNGGKVIAFSGIVAIILSTLPPAETSLVELMYLLRYHNLSNSTSLVISQYMTYLSSPLIILTLRLLGIVLLVISLNLVTRSSLTRMIISTDTTNSEQEANPD